MSNFFNIINRIANFGTTDQLKIEEKQRVRLTNILGMLPLLGYVVYIIFGIINHYYFPVIICTSLSVFVIIGLFFNYKGKHQIAKSILLSSNSIVVFATYNSLNIDYSIICYFFPLFIAYEIVFDAKKEIKYFLPTFLFTILCVVCCFVIPKFLFYKYNMSSDLLKSSVILNYLVPLILSILFIFTIIKIHSETQCKLILAREESDYANKAKSSFLSNITHELRTPLNGIIGATNLLMHEPATTSQNKYYEVLKHTSDHMLNLVNHILDFSKIKEDKIHLDRNVFNMKEVLLKLCSVYKTQNTHEFVKFNFHIDEFLDQEVLSDDLRINQILLNLLSNAFKFTKKGVVNFKAEKINDDKNFIKIKFTISDTGIGINSDQFEKVFESFEQADKSTTRNFGGTGLGLSISKQLVSLFDSSLKLESEIGKGSSFSFEIIVEKNQNKNYIPKGDVTKQHLNGLRVLVAEDNKINMMVLITFLKKWQVSFSEASNGLQALNMYQNNDYDVVLMDLEMPVMDGYTTISEIRKKDISTPIIAFTAALYDGMISDLKNKGFDDYIHKPFNPQDLFEKISKYHLN